MKEMENGVTHSSYTILPTHQAKGKIYDGYDTLATLLGEEKLYILDGYIGVNWEAVVESLTAELRLKNIKFDLISFEDAWKSETEIETLVSPYTGGNDPLFGTKADLSLIDFYDPIKINSFPALREDVLTIVYGSGAAFYSADAPLVYIDLPKTTLIGRMRKGQISNLGTKEIRDSKQTYKRFYFIDWEVLNRHKKELLPRTRIIADQQSDSTITWMYGVHLKETLEHMAQSFFRVRPAFEPGVWGGQWMKQHMTGLDQSPPNYAWSFEMIVPENGLILSDANNTLEVSFDYIMYTAGQNVLGRAYERFGNEFPIRFNFLDTFDGGNLSIQCHPSLSYAKQEFGEQITQDETYYVVDHKEGSQVYLGFQEDINPTTFRTALEDSFHTGTAIDIEKYVQKFTAQKHALYLIPNGTVHSSGTNNLVLEISATPYNFTFKMYDWVRPDLDGKPRPLNIDRAFDNLNFDRKGKVVQETLLSKPVVTSIDKNTSLVHLPTHEEHFYDVYRYDFTEQVSADTNGQCHILMLVEGTAVELTTSDGSQQIFNYVETFAIPAATGRYTLRNLGSTEAKVVVAYVKEQSC
jgi:mannose-6-phosphate isomerase class I